MKQSAALGAAPWVVSSAAFARTAPSDMVQVGVIGLGSRGFNLIDALLKATEVRIAAICDVDEFHYRDRAWGVGRAYGRRAAQTHIETALRKRKKSNRLKSGLLVTDDFRRVCNDERLDAVVVATPDHWHALCVMEALQNGKDVYCEKPVTHTFHEGQVVYREVAKRNAVFQTGSQQRSDPLFRRAVNLVRNGWLGTIQRIEVGLPPGYASPQGDTTISNPPQSIDYDRWCGPSTMLPYMRARHHRWWRGHREFGGGVLMDWIGHHNDIAHWGLAVDDSGPVEVEAKGWTEANTKVYNTPHHYSIHCRFASGVRTTISSRNPIGAKFIGEDGWVHVRRGKLTASDTRWVKANFSIGDQRVYESNDHMRNFLQCMRTRKDCVAPAETAHRSITPGHLGYISNAVGRPLSWDAKTETVIGDSQADSLLKSHRYRTPWTL